MDVSKLKKIITEADSLNADIDSERVMAAYHRLDDLGEHHLGELIDDYLLGKLDARRAKIFEDHLDTCESCKKEVAAMRVFIKSVKDLGNEIS